MIIGLLLTAIFCAIVLASVAAGEKLDKIIRELRSIENMMKREEKRKLFKE